MLNPLSDSNLYVIKSGNNRFGCVTGFYCDDQNWRIEFLVVELGDEALSHKILLSPDHIQKVSQEDKTFTVALSAVQLLNAIPEQNKKFISRKNITNDIRYYAYPGELSRLETDDICSDLNPRRQSMFRSSKTHEQEMLEQAANKQYRQLQEFNSEIEPQLRTYDSLIHCALSAADSELGCLEGMLIDCAAWTIDYFIVNTSHWWLGQQVLLTPDQIKCVSGAPTKIHTSLTRQEILDLPSFDMWAPSTLAKELDQYLHSTHLAPASASSSSFSYQDIYLHSAFKRN